MKKILLLSAISILFFSCKCDKKSEKQAEETKTEIAELKLADFDSQAVNYIDKEIKVTGIVDHICKHGGKKILLVTDDGDIHVFSDERFDEELMGSEIKVLGTVLEDRIDESYILKMEEDNIKSHSEGAYGDEQFENRKKHYQDYRDRMKNEGIEYISNFSLQYVSHIEIE